MSALREWDEDAMVFRRVHWDCPTCGERYHESEPTCEDCQCDCGARLVDGACPDCDVLGDAAIEADAVARAEIAEVQS